MAAVEVAQAQMASVASAAAGAVEGAPLAAAGATCRREAPHADGPGPQRWRTGTRGQSRPAGCAGTGCRRCRRWRRRPRGLPRSAPGRAARNSARPAPAARASVRPLRWVELRRAAARPGVRRHRSWPRTGAMACGTFTGELVRRRVLAGVQAGAAVVARGWRGSATSAVREVQPARHGRKDRRRSLRSSGRRCRSAAAARDFVRLRRYGTSDRGKARPRGPALQALHGCLLRLRPPRRRCRRCGRRPCRSIMPTPAV
jgi:hypothetical protein